MAVAAASPAGRTRAAGDEAILPRPTVRIPAESAAMAVIIAATMAAIIAVTMAAAMAAFMAETPIAAAGIIPAASTKAAATITADGFGLVLTSVSESAFRSAMATTPVTGAATTTDMAIGYRLPVT